MLLALARLLTAPSAWHRATYFSRSQNVTPATPPPHIFYSSIFPVNEEPLSERNIYLTDAWVLML